MLTVEDGSGVVGADSYISLADARLFLQSVGLTLATVDADAEIQLRQAFYYLEAKSYRGEVTDPAQLTKFPRKYLTRNEVAIPDDTVPLDITRAQAYYAAAVASGVKLDSIATVQAQKASVKIGEIATTFYKSNSFGMSRVTAAEKLLNNFISESGGFTTVVRA